MVSDRQREVNGTLLRHGGAVERLDGRKRIQHGDAILILDDMTADGEPPYWELTFLDPPSTPRTWRRSPASATASTSASGTLPGTSLMLYAMFTDAGCASGENQDRVGADPRRGTFIVADGMGGLADGGSTAQTVVDLLPGRLSDRVRTLTGADVVGSVAAVTTELNEQVRRSARYGPGNTGAATALMLGTYAFLPPEVLRDEGDSCAGDVWSMGTIADLLLTNHFPYEDDSGGRANALSSFSIARFRRPLLPPSTFNDDVDTALDAVVVATLDIDPRRRTPTARALAAALRERRAAIGRAGGRSQASSATATATAEPTERARRLADEAPALARRPRSPGRAADLMEEAINLSPGCARRTCPDSPCGAEGDDVKEIDRWGAPW